MTSDMLYTCAIRDDLRLAHPDDMAGVEGKPSCSSTSCTIVFDNKTNDTGKTTASSDDQSVVTVPTVASLVDYDNDYNDSDCDSVSCDHHCHGIHDFASVASCSNSSHLNTVSFSMVQQVYEIPNSRWDYTAQEIEATWYNRREKDVMRDAAFGIAESLDDDYFQDTTTTSNFRGLEAYTRQGSQQRKLHRVKNLIAVLREQRRQRSCGELVTIGPELIHAACYPISSKCQQLAHIQGRRDERDARQIYSTTSISSTAGGSDERSHDGTDTSPNMLLHLTKLLRDLGQS